MTDQTMTARDVIDLLAAMENRSRANARQLPGQVEQIKTWSGLTYMLAGVRVVSAMSEVNELLQHPEHITAVPRAKDWMLGVANLRGNLMPIIDLQVFLGGKPVVPSKSSRVLVINLRGVNCGLLVPSVLGMRHYDEANRISQARMDGAIGNYVYEAFGVGKEIWPVFSLAALAAEPEFRSAAA